MASRSLSFVTDRLKWAFTTRRVERGEAQKLLPADDAVLSAAVPGDLVLARIERIGAHRRLQLAAGRPAALYPDDLVVVACGARYASDQFEGVAELRGDGADLLAGGGVLGRCIRAHGRMATPTRAVPIGLLARSDDTVLNLRHYALRPRPLEHRPTVLCVAGTSMNAGKTTAMASLVHGLARAGHRIAAIKATGTGAFGDVNAFADAGAAFVADFTDAGMASTYLEPLERIRGGIDLLLGHAAADACDVALIELADGLLQRETAALLNDPGFRARCDGVVFAAGDAIAAAGGVARLGDMGISPVALTGVLTRSPMAMAEVEAAIDVPVMTRGALLDPARASALLHRVERARGPHSVGTARRRGGAAGMAA